MSETNLGISVDAVSYHYGKRVALDNISLNVEMAGKKISKGLIALTVPP